MPETRKLLLEFNTDEVGRLARTNANEMKALIRAFSDSSDVVRERALIAAIETANPNIVTDVVKALNDDAANVRIAAAQALAFYHQPRTIPNLLQGLKDSNTWVRSHCAAGLSKIFNGPLWARLPEDSIDKMIGNFPDMMEEDVNKLLTSIKMKPDGINRFKEWQSKNFDLEIDIGMIAEELEGTPILLTGEAGKSAAFAKTAKVGLSEDVDSILSELPDEIIATLPPEDLKRLTPDSARELVQKLKVTLPVTEKKKKKAVKVRKVTKVKKKEAGPSRASLIKKLPPEVRESVTDETLSSLTIEELQALLASSGVEAEEEEKAEEITEEPKYDDPRMAEFVKKYGKEKAELLITIPESMLEGIPEEQIKEMDLETLQGLSQALEPR